MANISMTTFTGNVASHIADVVDTDKLQDGERGFDSDYDNLLDSDSEAAHETKALLKRTNINATSSVRPSSLNLDTDRSSSSLNNQLNRHSIGTLLTANAVEQNESQTKQDAVVVQFTSGNANENRSWSQLKASAKSNSIRNSRTDEDPSLTSQSAVRALGSERIGNLSGQNHQQPESPFGYKNWLIHLGRRRRCEILILIGLILWLAFFFVLAIVLNGNSWRNADQSDDDIIAAGSPTPTNDSVPFDNSSAEIDGENTTPLRSTADAKRPSTTIHAEPNSKDATNSPIVTESPSTAGIKNAYHTLRATTGRPVTELSGYKKTSASMNFDEIAAVPSLMPVVTAIADPSSTSTVILETVTPTAADISTVNHHVDMTQPGTIVPGDERELKGAGEADDTNEIQYPSASDFLNTTDIIKGKSPNYLIGVGRADITGPAADVNMMGYANPSQTSGGIHIRQFARAFIIQDPETKIRTVFVNIDACMSSTLVKLEVLKVLKLAYGDLYTAENLCISGTHTHSAPAGFLQDVLFQISSLGFVDETLTSMVNGIVESIQRAHHSIQPGYIFLNKGKLLDTNINRSPMAYLNNPAEEKARYPYNVDKDMTLLKFLDDKGNGLGMINWFPVHCTSMNNTNSLISGDNKGYAELLFEEMMDPGSLPGMSKFVAAFAQSNEGDVSPNTRGPHCLDTGEKCDNIHSTCDGKVQNCVAFGPGKNMFESTKIIGTNQYKKAKELYESASLMIKGPVNVTHQYLDMTKFEVTVNESVKVKTCKPAMGFSFAAGTTDGPGAFDFKQGDKSGSNLFWRMVRNFLHSPSEDQIKCHHPKPILLDTGEMDTPYEWQPNIVDTQLLRIGQFMIIAVPGEFSTMAGRRLRNGVLKTLFKFDRKNRYEAVIAGLANTYSDYITTYEEYQVQRYEGASTIYGPYTEMAYIQQYKKLASLMLQGDRPMNDVQPPNNKKSLYSFLTGVIFDRPPLYHSMGDVTADVKSSYTAGEEVVVKFVAGNPRNSLQMQPNVTFLVVERELADGSWKIIHTDASWETKYIWKRTSTIAGTSEVTIVWETDLNTKPGLYRIAHRGHYKYWISGVIYPYSGQSSNFRIEDNS